MKYSIAAAAAVILAGCAVGPNYKRPAIALPEQFRGAAPQKAADASIADTKWQDLFNDAVLRQLVETALQQNFDLRIAAERVQQARAQLDSRRANLFPFIDGQVGFTANRSSTVGSVPLFSKDINLNYAVTQAALAPLGSWSILG